METSSWAAKFSIIWKVSAEGFAEIKGGGGGVSFEGGFTEKVTSEPSVEAEWCGSFI